MDSQDINKIIQVRKINKYKEEGVRIIKGASPKEVMWSEKPLLYIAPPLGSIPACANCSKLQSSFIKYCSCVDCKSEFYCSYKCRDEHLEFHKDVCPFFQEDPPDDMEIKQILVILAVIKAGKKKNPALFRWFKKRGRTEIQRADPNDHERIFSRRLIYESYANSLSCAKLYKFWEYFDKHSIRIDSGVSLEEHTFRGNSLYQYVSKVNHDCLSHNALPIWNHDSNIITIKSMSRLRPNQEVIIPWVKPNVEAHYMELLVRNMPCSCPTEFCRAQRSLKVKKNVDEAFQIVKKCLPDWHPIHNYTDLMIIMSGKADPIRNYHFKKMMKRAKNWWSENQTKIYKTHVLEYLSSKGIKIE